MGGSWKERRTSNATRTKTLSIPNTPAEGVVLDLSFLDHGEDVVSVTLRPATAGAILMSGKAGDDFVSIAAGITLDVDLNPRNAARLPSFKATSGTVGMDVIASIYVRDGESG
jgi:hypothetical protein